MKNETKKLHLATIRKHRRAVRKMCFKMGIPVQGILHDLSKYSKVEMAICQFATGKKSPHDIAREKLGYSPSWCHHAVKNPHHWEHWLDIGPIKDNRLQVVPVKMPYKYVIEMFCDMVGASKTYGGKDWKPEDVWNYWNNKRKQEVLMHHDSKYLLEKMFWNYSVHGEKEFFKFYHKTWKKYWEEIYNKGNMQLHEESIFDIN